MIFTNSALQLPSLATALLSNDIPSQPPSLSAIFLCNLSSWQPAFLVTSLFMKFTPWQLLSLLRRLVSELCSSPLGAAYIDLSASKNGPLTEVEPYMGSLFLSFPGFKYTWLKCQVPRQLKSLQVYLSDLHMN